jgi:hypothetical protein
MAGGRRRQPAQARVKRCGKSAPASGATPAAGNPHPEQGQAWDGRPGRCPQVGRTDGWPPGGNREGTAHRIRLIDRLTVTYRSDQGRSNLSPGAGPPVTRLVTRGSAAGRAPGPGCRRRPGASGRRSERSCPRCRPGLLRHVGSRPHTHLQRSIDDASPTPASTPPAPPTTMPTTHPTAKPPEPHAGVMAAKAPRNRVTYASPTEMPSLIRDMTGSKEKSMLAYDYPLLGIFWSITIFFLWVGWIFAVSWVFIDNFRRQDHSGWANALWALAIILVPIPSPVRASSRPRNPCRWRFCCRARSRVLAERAARGRVASSSYARRGPVPHRGILPELREEGGFTGGPAGPGPPWPHAGLVREAYADHNERPITLALTSLRARSRYGQSAEGRHGPGVRGHSQGGRANRASSVPLRRGSWPGGRVWLGVPMPGVRRR